MASKKTERSIELLTTDDGSHSLYVPSLNETYHSFHGAVQESRHVFIKMGLDELITNDPDRKTISVLEVGLGTGLNALLTAQWAFENEVKVNMTSLEAFPIDIELAEQLNYTKIINHDSADEWFKKIHTSSWNEKNSINQWFNLNKVETKLELHALPPQFYDVVYFDAFAPNKQSELWELDVLNKVFKAQSPGGIFVTYCAKGQLKRDLRQLGYEVKTLAGPPGKKEMVRGKVV